MNAIRNAAVVVALSLTACQPSGIVTPINPISHDVRVTAQQVIVANAVDKAFANIKLDGVESGKSAFVEVVGSLSLDMREQTEILDYIRDSAEVALAKKGVRIERRKLEIRDSHLQVGAVPSHDYRVTVAVRAVGADVLDENFALFFGSQQTYIGTCSVRVAVAKASTGDLAAVSEATGEERWLVKKVLFGVFNFDTDHHVKGSLLPFL